MKRRYLLLISVCFCLVGVLGGYSLGVFLSSLRSYYNEKSSLALSTPGHSMGLQSSIAAMADFGLSTAEGGVSFLVEEAGICAYGNVDQEINLTKAKEVFRGLEYECEDYIIGSVPIPGYPESEDVHVYVHRTGWIVAYYSKTEYVAKIIKDFINPEDNKIQNAIAVICNALWIGIPEIHYYDFRYPDANTLIVVGDRQPDRGTNTFRILVPAEIANNISKFEWYYYGTCQSDFERGEFVVHGQVLCSGRQAAYGSMTLVPEDKPDELMKPTELKLDTLTECLVKAGYYGSPLPTNAGFIILLHYD